MIVSVNAEIVSAKNYIKRCLCPKINIKILVSGKIKVLLFDKISILMSKAETAGVSICDTCVLCLTGQNLQRNVRGFKSLV